jgi:hypothetical protein
MKSLLTCLAIGTLFAGSAIFCKCSKASQRSDDACHEFAERYYEQAQALGVDAPDFAYEAAQAACDAQAYGLSLVPDPIDERERPSADDLIEIGTIRAVGMSLRDALDAADAQGRYGVERYGMGWLPTTAAEDAASDLDR